MISVYQKDTKHKKLMEKNVMSDRAREKKRRRSSKAKRKSFDTVVRGLVYI